MAVEVCDVCGSSDIKEVKCKVICQNCGTILKTCADLTAVTPSLRDTPHGS
jgi:hypothetical protein